MKREAAPITSGQEGLLSLRVRAHSHTLVLLVDLRLRCTTTADCDSRFTLRPGDHLLTVLTPDRPTEIREVIDSLGNASMPLLGKLYVAGKTLRQVRMPGGAADDACWPQPLTIFVSKSS